MEGHQDMEGSEVSGPQKNNTTTASEEYIPAALKINMPIIKDPAEFHDIEVTVDIFLKWWNNSQCISKQKEFIIPFLEWASANGSGDKPVSQVLLEHLSYWIHQCREELIEEMEDYATERAWQKYRDTGVFNLPEFGGYDYMSKEYL
jgi:hypothetical protein